MRDSLYEAINLYYKAFGFAPDNKKKASIHKNLTKAHELMSQQESLEIEMRLFEFDRMVKEASKALKIGVGIMGLKWRCEFVERG